MKILARLVLLCLVALQLLVLIGFAFAAFGGTTAPPPLAFDFSHAPPGSVVYDIVTHPLDTPLLIEARTRGFPTIDGLAMLIGQAALAFEKFFGKPAPRQHDAELRALLIE